MRARSSARRCAGPTGTWCSRAAKRAGGSRSRSSVRPTQTTVEELLNDLSFLRASGFVDAPTPEQARALEHPELEVELTIEGGGGGQAGRVGCCWRSARARAARADRLVRADGPGLFRIPSERLQDFPREVGSYRFRELAHFDLDQAERLEIVFQPAGEAALTLTRHARRRGLELDARKRSTRRSSRRMIDELSRLRAKQILADAMGEAELRQLGLAPPSARFTVSGKSGQLAQVDLGMVRGSDGVVARATGGPTVYLLAPTLADYLPVSLEALRSRFLAKAGRREARRRRPGRLPRARRRQRRSRAPKRARPSPDPAFETRAVGGGGGWAPANGSLSSFRDRSPEPAFVASRKRPPCGPAPLYFAVRPPPAASHRSPALANQGQANADHESSVLMNGLRECSAAVREGFEGRATRGSGACFDCRRDPVSCVAR